MLKKIIFMIFFLSISLQACDQGCLSCNKDDQCIFCNFFTGYALNKDSFSCEMKKIISCNLQSTDGTCLICDKFSFPSDGKCAKVEG